MRKQIAIFFALFYLVASTGIGISVHFCGEQVAAIQFLTTEAGSCCCDSEAVPSSCCSDDQEYVQLSDEEVPVQVLQENILPKTALIVLRYLLPPPSEHIFAQVKLEMAEKVSNVQDEAIFIRYHRLTLYA